MILYMSLNIGGHGGQVDSCRGPYPHIRGDLGVVHLAHHNWG